MVVAVGGGGTGNGLRCAVRGLVGGEVSLSLGALGGGGETAGAMP